MTDQARDQETNVLHPLQETGSRSLSLSQRRAYQKPALTLFGSVEEFTRGSGYGSLDASGKNRRAG